MLLCKSKHYIGVNQCMMKSLHLEDLSLQRCFWKIIILEIFCTVMIHISMGAISVFKKIASWKLCQQFTVVAVSYPGVFVSTIVVKMADD